MNIGKYQVRAVAEQSEQGNYYGKAQLLWNDEDATYESSILFHKPFDTAEQARNHSLEQVQLRVRDGVL